MPNSVSVNDLTVDTVVPPRELFKTGKEFSKAVAMLIQTFGYEIALPYLKRFQERCKAEHVAIPPAPDKGRPIVMDETFIPEVETTGSVLIRCRCRPGRPVDLSQDFALAELAAMPPP
ncbi:hypothetical protein DXG01_017118, partial [Tephrocybe rancida]